MEREKIHSRKRPCHWMAAVIISLFVLPLSTPNAKPKPSTTAGSSSKENAPQQPTAPLTTANGHPSICPHTWNTDAYTEKDYYRGTGWYRRQLTLPQGWKEKQIILRLDAAGKSATIYINGKNVGEHAGGYTACSFNITSFLSFDTPNTLAVCVDNARQDIAPISGDFTFFGGIYRDVWLTAVPNQHFNPRTTARTVCSSAPRRFPSRQPSPYAVK